MAGVWTTITILDGTSASRNMRAWDESGAGTGPYSFGQTTNNVGETFTDRSSTITVGGTSQQLAASNTNRRRLIIQNPGTSTGQGIAAAESLFINFTTSAGINNGTSLELLTGQTWDSGVGPVSTEAVNVNATTTGHTYVAKEL